MYVKDVTITMISYYNLRDVDIQYQFKELENKGINISEFCYNPIFDCIKHDNIFVEQKDNVIHSIKLMYNNSDNKNKEQCYYEEHKNDVKYIEEQELIQQSIKNNSWKQLCMNDNIPEHIFEQNNNNVLWEFLSNNKSVSGSFLEKYINNDNCKYILNSKIYINYIVTKRLLYLFQ